MSCSHFHCHFGGVEDYIRDAHPASRRETLLYGNVKVSQYGVGVDPIVPHAVRPTLAAPGRGYSRISEKISLVLAGFYRIPSSSH